MLSLLTSPCNSFCFYGAYAKDWRADFDLFSNPPSTDDSKAFIAWTSYPEAFDDFIAEMHAATTARYFVPTDIFLIYDDDARYKQALERLNAMQACAACQPT